MTILPPLLALLRRYIRFHGNRADVRSALPFLPVRRLGSIGTRHPPPRPPHPPSGRAVPSAREHGHIHMQIYSAAVCRWIRARVRGRTRRRPARSRGGESHKLNDVNALSTLCRSEWRRRSALRTRPPGCLLAAAGSAPSLPCFPLPIAPAPGLPRRPRRSSLSSSPLTLHLAD